MTSIDNFNADYVKKLASLEAQKDNEIFTNDTDKLINILKDLILKDKQKKFVLVTNNNFPEFSSYIKKHNKNKNLINYFETLGFKVEFNHTNVRSFKGGEFFSLKIEW